PWARGTCLATDCPENRRRKLDDEHVPGWWRRAWAGGGAGLSGPTADNRGKGRPNDGVRQEFRRDLRDEGGQRRHGRGRAGQAGGREGQQRRGEKVRTAYG